MDGWLAEHEQTRQRWSEMDVKAMSLAEAYDELRAVDECETCAHLFARRLFEDEQRQNPSGENGDQEPDTWSDSEASESMSVSDESRYDGDEWQFRKPRYPVEYPDALAAAVRDYHGRCEALRSHVETLSKPSVRQPSITHLPREILQLIFAFVNDYTGEHLYTEKQLIRMVKSLRLVCRVFYQLASSLPFNAIEVSASEDSLSRLIEVSQTPRLANGVECVFVNLASYARELADDYEEFREARCEQIQQLLHHHTSTLRLKPRVSPEEALKSVRKASELQHFLRLQEDDPELPNKNPMSLRSAYIQYVAKHKEQSKLIESGRLVKGITQSMARLQQGTALRFIDHVRGWIVEWNDAPAAEHHNLDRLYPILTSPHDWLSLHELHQGWAALNMFEPSFVNVTKVPIASVLCDLPIALQGEGVLLRRLEIALVPALHAMCSLTSIRQELRQDEDLLWTKLSAAFSRLESFNFEITEDDWWGSANENDMFPSFNRLNKYLSCVLSGQSLTSLGLWFCHIYNHAEETHCYPITRLFRRTNWPHLKRLSVEHATMTLTELEALCRAPGVNSLTRLNLRTLEVRDGSWAQALDILREKIRSQPAMYDRCGRHRRLGGRIRVSDLTGWDIDPEEQPPDFKLPQVEAYLAHGLDNEGLPLENPLRESLSA